MPRFLEITVAFVAIILLSPVLLIAAIAVKVSSPGPVIFSHMRVGKDGVPFGVHKFRSMTTAPAGSGSSLTVGGDNRVTSVGRVLRGSKLDELPQLFNVLFGTMSLVGPRPETADLLEHYPEEAKAVMLSVRPGITDPSSIIFRDEEGELAAQSDPHAYYRDVIIGRKCEMYMDYIPRKSFGFDVKTILQTIVAVIDRKGRLRG